MKMKLFSLFAAAMPLLIASFLSVTPAKAWPPCIPEVLIRCSGHSINNYGPITGYPSVEACATAEVPFRCGVQFDPDEWNLDDYAALTRKEEALA